MTTWIDPDTRIPEQAILCLGSNLGDCAAQLARARNAIAELPETRIDWWSNLHRTAAYGLEDQPDFLNQLVVTTTSLLPHPLLRAIKHIELQLGRQSRERWGPREIDIDILFYGNWRVETPDLCIPHADWHNREFVHQLLAEWKQHCPQGEPRRDHQQHPL